MNAGKLKNKGAWTLEKRDSVMGWVMISPILIGIALFSVLPVLFSFFISFHEWDMLHEREWVGMANYVNIFSDKMLGVISKNTFTY